MRAIQKQLPMQKEFNEMKTWNLNYLTADELISLNSVSGGGELQGIDLRRGMLYFTKEKNEEILNCLEKKQIITSDYKLTQYGICLVHLIRQYRESMIHCKLNYERFALLKKGQAIVIQPKDNGYVIAEIPKESILYRIMKAYISLWKGTEVCNQAEYLFVQKWKNGREQEHMVYFWNGDGSYKCDINTKKRRTITSKEIRKELIKVLEMEETECQIQKI